MNHLVRFLASWGRALVTFSVTVLAALTTFLRAPSAASRTSSFVQGLLQHEVAFRYSLLGLAILGAVLEIARKAYTERHEHAELIAWLLDDFVKKHLGDGPRTTRLTLFKASRGWRLIFWCYLHTGKSRRSPFRWQAARALRISRRYLGVYARSSHSANPQSSTAFYVDDAGVDTEGVAGRIFEEGKVTLPLGHLVSFSREDVRSITATKLAAWPTSIAQYARETNLKSLTSLQAMDVFPRFFHGSRVRGPRGQVWGVLLLDCSEDSPKLVALGEGRSHDEKDAILERFYQSFDDLALFTGKLVR